MTDPENYIIYKKKKHSKFVPIPNLSIIFLSKETNSANVDILKKNNLAFFLR